ncbi:hypothetical protein [Komagataeibacter sp. FXV3]|uniref:hypothetical protein n=1 Tax=Komagataeibacter sp. FXV3 TaxID=2608998 RepID=UPI00187B79EF|nr:hypothetical protein [Komagataeibacter sp. FXV3]MBE7730519.1 hypothetical protein [Komagataeibacter sp. FXV3]
MQLIFADCYFVSKQQRFAGKRDIPAGMADFFPSFFNSLLDWDFFLIKLAGKSFLLACRALTGAVS